MVGGLVGQVLREEVGRVKAEGGFLLLPGETAVGFGWWEPPGHWAKLRSPEPRTSPWLVVGSTQGCSHPVRKAALKGERVLKAQARTLSAVETWVGGQPVSGRAEQGLPPSR